MTIFGHFWPTYHVQQFFPVNIPYLGALLDPPTYPKIGHHLWTFPCMIKKRVANTKFKTNLTVQVVCLAFFFNVSIFLEIFGYDMPISPDYAHLHEMQLFFCGKGRKKSSVHTRQRCCTSYVFLLWNYTPKKWQSISFFSDSKIT